MDHVCTVYNSAVECRVLWKQLPELVNDTFRVRVALHGGGHATPRRSRQHARLGPNIARHQTGREQGRASLNADRELEGDSHCALPGYHSTKRQTASLVQKMYIKTRNLLLILLDIHMCGMEYKHPTSCRISQPSGSCWARRGRLLGAPVCALRGLSVCESCAWTT